MRSGLYLLITGAVVSTLVGCAQISVEDAAIARFTTALQNQNLDHLKTATTNSFQAKALRNAESLDDLRILRLPKETPTVAKIEDVSETEKNVIVTSEGSGRRLLYRLVRGSSNQEWLVDDIYTKQKQKGLKVTRSVTEQMDLLLSVREFLSTWETGDRNHVLATTTPEFSKVLQELSPRSLSHLTKQVTNGKSDRTSFRPEAQLNSDRAVVRLPRTNGELLVSFSLMKSQWMVDDVGIKSSDRDADSITLRRQAEILVAGSKFLSAYGVQDKAALKDICTLQFHKGALLPSDLSRQPLPGPGLLDDNHEIKSHKNHASIIVPYNEDIVKIDLQKMPSEDDSGQPGVYRVEDVTLFGTNGSQQRRLSSVFTAQARLLIFSDALARGDMSLVKRMSTNDFNDRVWKHVDDQLIRQLPLESARAVISDVVESEYLGAMTRLTTTTDGQSITWSMKESNGQIAVDDFMILSETMPESMKQRLEVLVPAIRFAMALHSEDVKQLARVCSRDFNRVVWKHTKTVPDMGVPIAQMLTSPLKKVQKSQSHGLVQLGNESWGARLHMLQDVGHWVVDDVTLITGMETASRIELKHAFRHQLAVESRRSSRSDRAVAVAQLPDAPRSGRRTADASVADSLEAPTNRRDNAKQELTESNETQLSTVVPAVFEFEPEPSPAINRVVDPADSPVNIPFD